MSSPTGRPRTVATLARRSFLSRARRRNVRHLARGERSRRLTTAKRNDSSDGVNDEIQATEPGSRALGQEQRRWRRAATATKTTAATAT
ncbi:hypothetical protein GW17_00006599 [Ensete ventricosum]|nr:hypothetical protein GW17_00006599 [Ensete ventricosum]